MADRLSTHLEVSGLTRAVSAEGGFAAVLHKGDRDSGTILVVTRAPGAISRLYERMPDLDGHRRWTCAKTQSPENPEEFDKYLTRRCEQDRDCWLVELDIANAERFIGLTGTEA